MILCRSSRQAPATHRPLAFAVVVVALFLVACHSDGTRDRRTRAVVIGIDGADWKIIDALAAEGRMPNIDNLRSMGVHGSLETLHDIPLSPVIWTSVATGKTAAKHGITWFLVDQPDGTRVPVRSYNRKAKAIWNIVAAADKTPVVMGWWATYPAEPLPRGAVVSDALGFHGFGSTGRGESSEGKTYPPELFAKADALFPTEQQLSYAFTRRFIDIGPADYRREMFDPARDPRRDPTNPLHLFQQYAVTAQGYSAVAKELLATRDYDLFMAYFEQVDSISHLFMKYGPPRLEWTEEAAFERYRDAVREWYVYQDELLGELLATIDLRHTAVFVLSDHGFKSGERRIRSERTIDVNRAHLDHETHGIFIAAGPYLRRTGLIEGASVLDITPTVLHYLGLPVAKDMDGKVLVELFDPSFVTRNPIRYVTTYEADRHEGEGRRAEVAAPDEEAEWQEEALRSLGYLGSSEAHESVRTDAQGSSDVGESSPEIHINMGRIHLQGANLVSAEREFREALRLDPTHAEALLQLGTLRQLEGRVLEAERLAERALQLDPNSIGALSQLADIKRDRGDLDEAIRLYEVALSIDDALPFVYLGYGDVLQKAGRLDDAEAAFRLVLELDPDSFEAHYNLGVTYANQGHPNDAIHEYQEALTLDSDHPNAAKAYNNLGAIFLHRGDADGAVTRFEQAVQGSPGNFEASYNLASLYLDRDRVDEAIHLLEAATAQRPNHLLASLALATAYLRSGRNDDAYRIFTLVSRLYPESWQAPLGMALLLAAGDQPAESRLLLEEALRIGGDQARAAAAEYPLLNSLLDEDREH